MSKTITCFSTVDFHKPGGETIRISGIVNALASKGMRINFVHANKLHENVKHEQSTVLPQSFRTLNKRKFQFVLTYGGVETVNFLFKKLLADAKRVFATIDGPVIFFNHLDISIGYWLFRNKIISSYIIDVHGISHLEFDLNETKSPLTWAMNQVKKQTALTLEKKIYRNATKILYTSKGVQDHVERLYGLNQKQALIVEESINQLLLDQSIDEQLRNHLIEKHQLNQQDGVLLFAGSFKQFGGIIDLIKAYVKLQHDEPKVKTKLLLVGDGPLFAYCKQMLDGEGSVRNDVVFLGRQAYEKLKTFHAIADIIICPDKDTYYSQILPHIKYFDAISSGKIVINGAFQFTEEMNPNQRFSLNFTPSDVDSLADTMKYAVLNKEPLLARYQNARKEATALYNYEHTVEPLYQWLIHR